MILRPVAIEDLDDLHALYSDPRVWRHFPTLRFTDPARTERMLRRWVANWAHGLGQWTILTDEGEFVGHGGAQVEHDGSVWNVGYRIRPEFWGRGIAGDSPERNPDPAAVRLVYADRDLDDAVITQVVQSA